MPGPESCICNLHYKDFRGPTRSNPNVTPVHFKRPHEFYSMASDNNQTRKRRLSIRHAQGSMSSLEQSSEEQLDHGSSEDDSREEGLNAESVTTKLNLLQEELESLTAEIKMLRATPQRLVISLLSLAQVAMYTGISKMLFDSLLDWLSPTLGMQVHDSPRGCSPNVPLSNSQKLLLVLNACAYAKMLARKT